GMPGPISLNDLRRRAGSDFRAGDARRGRRQFAGASSHFRDAKGVAGPFHQVTVAPAFPACLDLGIEGITFVGRTMIHLVIADLLVQGAVGGPDVSPVVGGIPGNIGWVWPIATD